MVPHFPVETQGGPIKVNDDRKWVTYQDYKYDSDDFEKIGGDFESKFEIKIGHVGSAESRLIRMKPLVDFAVDWISKNRK